ncbi:MAG: PqqD family protein [Flavobacteriales bacterium]|nr:PqqD family protein [Flavobacteriales bacterium]
MEMEALKQTKERFAERKVGNETILVPLSGNVADLNEMYTLNEVGSFIWEKLDSMDSIDEVVVSVLNEFDVDKHEAEQDVNTFLQELSQFISKHR